MLFYRRLLNIRPDAFINSCTETCQFKQETRIPGRLRFLMRGSHGLASRPISYFASLQQAARLMRTPTPACASSAKGRRMTLIGSCSALTPRHTPPLISCVVSLPSIAHSYFASLFHTAFTNRFTPWTCPSRMASYWPHQSDSWKDSPHHSMLFIYLFFVLLVVL